MANLRNAAVTSSELPRGGDQKAKQATARVRSTDVKAAPKIQLYLDSGAFSAWSKKEVIDIDDYCNYIDDHQDWIAYYVNLDVIPGQKGSKRTIALAEEAAELSFKNYMYMRSRGLKPIPVVHKGEKFLWVQKYIDEGADYIGLSPSTGMVSKVDSMAWLDGVFTRLTNKDGVPFVKTHGFAVASFDLMKRYPWTTCDASSWALTAAFGGLYIPAYRLGKPDYSQAPSKISVSEYEDRTKVPTDHYTRFGPLMKERVKLYLEKEVGVTVEAASLDYEVRARAVVHFMLKFEEAIGEVRFRHRQGGFGA